MTAAARLRRLADAAAGVDRMGPGDAAQAACRTLAELLGLDAAWLLSGSRVDLHTTGHWARPGAAAARLGDHRLRALIGGAVDDVCQAQDGRYAVVIVRVSHEPSAPVYLVGSVRSTQPFAGDDLVCARLVGATFGASLRQLPPPAPPVREPGAPTADPVLLLRMLAAAIAGKGSEADVALAVIDSLRTVIECHAGRVYLLAPTGDRLVAVAHFGTQSVEGDPGELLECAVGEGIAGHAFVDVRARRIPDARHDQWAVEVPGTPTRDESMLVAPMLVEGDPIGVIVLSKEGLDRFDDHDLALLEAVASTAAVGCENAGHYQRALEQAELAQALLNLGAALALQNTLDGVARMVARALDRLVESAALSVWLRDGSRLRVAAQSGYTPAKAGRLAETEIEAFEPPFGAALERRRVTVLDRDEAGPLKVCLEGAPAGSTLAVVAVGERAGNRGAIVLQRGPRRGAPTWHDEQMLLGIADQALLALTNRALYVELEASFLSTVQALANALETKDEYTGDHAQALIGLSTMVAKRLGISGPALRDVSFAAAMHDVGKIGIPAEILNKPSSLTPEEWQVMKLHPELGARIIEPVPALAGARELVLACHEHWDGSGYPEGLAGEQIPLGARIILACDAFHAMTSDRVYRRALGLEEALAELGRCAGSHFDPEVAEALIESLRPEGERVDSRRS